MHMGLLHLLRLRLLPLPGLVQRECRPLHAPSRGRPRADQGGLEGHAPLRAAALFGRVGGRARRHRLLLEDRQGRRRRFALFIVGCLLHELCGVGSLLGAQGPPRLEDWVQVKEKMSFFYFLLLFFDLDD